MLDWLKFACSAHWTVILNHSFWSFDQVKSTGFFFFGVVAAIYPRLFIIEWCVRLFYFTKVQDTRLVLVHQRQSSWNNCLFLRSVLVQLLFIIQLYLKKNLYMIIPLFYFTKVQLIPSNAKLLNAYSPNFHSKILDSFSSIKSNPCETNCLFRSTEYNGFIVLFRSRRRSWSSRLFSPCPEISIRDIDCTSKSSTFA